MFFRPESDGIAIQKKMVLGLQHTFTMFGATVLVPILTGLNVSVALFMAGVCTILFHLINQGKVPIFLGSSFAYITPIITVGSLFGLQYAQGGVVISGLVYALLALIIKAFGVEKVLKFFPPIVTGPIIVIIGLTLAPVAVSSASNDWLLAAISFIIVLVIAILTRGFIKMIPVLCGLVGGYIVAVLMGKVDFTAVGEAAWIGIPAFTIAKFNASAVLLIVPVAIVTFVEHIGDIIAIGTVCNKNFAEDPGLHRTLLGDGLMTSLSSMFGGPANTTYSENTGVIALTKVFDPFVMQIAACFAILISMCPKFAAVIASIPGGVIGGISIVLFGMISATGIRSIVDNKVDFSAPRNLFIAATILVIGLGGTGIQINNSLSISTMALAAVLGIVLNKVLPQVKIDEKG